MAEARETTVVIPAFNEAQGIATTVAGLKPQGFAEILVVDDGSTDDTAERAEAAGARVVRHPYNKGNGAAVKTGIREAATPVILLMDADTQHDPAEASRLIGPVLRWSNKLTPSPSRIGATSIWISSTHPALSACCKMLGVQITTSLSSATSFARRIALSTSPGTSLVPHANSTAVNVIGISRRYDVAARCIASATISGW